MILSYHPCFTADENRSCAGRSPNAADLAAIQKAAAVILPQGCTAALYAMARQNCHLVFPNYAVRFTHAGKTGQISLFQETRTPHPPSACFADTKRYALKAQKGHLSPALTFPMVFKFDWGGEGETVRLIQNRADLKHQLQQARQYESSGQQGFLLQTFIPAGGRVLRVVRIGTQCQSYWRVAPGPDQFHVNVAKGATIDHDTAPDLQARAKALVNRFCARTGVNLAGFDVIFSENDPEPNPLMLEINYFFGREGLGGSAAYLGVLTAQMRHWLKREGLIDE